MGIGLFENMVPTCNVGALIKPKPLPRGGSGAYPMNTRQRYTVNGAPVTFCTLRVASSPTRMRRKLKNPEEMQMDSNLADK